MYKKAHSIGIGGIGMSGVWKRFISVRLVYSLAKVYWFFRRPTTHGAKIVIRNGDNILCVRHTYQSEYWTFPGGGLKRGEHAEEALRREVLEEVGVRLEHISYAGKFETKQDFKNDTIEVYCVSINSSTVTPDPFEIAEVKWFPLSDMPKLPPNAKKIFDIAYPHL